jgi:DNA-binding transcriptional LysR family regulator
VCLFRRGHRIDKKKLTLAEFQAAEHLVVVSAGTGHGKVHELLQRAGAERIVRLTVPHFVGVGHILQSTDLVATVPEKLAQRLVEPFGLTYLHHPVRLPEIAINVFWHAKVHRSPANQWLRGVVFDLFAEDGSAGRSATSESAQRTNGRSPYGASSSTAAAARRSRS